MVYLVFIFYFILVLGFLGITSFLLKIVLDLLGKNLFKRKFFTINLSKFIVTALVLSAVSSMYISYRTVYPSDSQLIKTFETSFNLKFPKSGEIISKKSDSGFNDSFTYFTIRVEKQKEFENLKRELIKQNYKISSLHSYRRKTDTVYTVTRFNTYNIQFLNNKEIYFEEIN